MKGLRKAVTFVLVFSIVFGLFPGALQKAFAAPVPINIYVDSYIDGTMTFHWDAVSTNLSTIITYHSPIVGGGATPNTIVLNAPVSNSFSISGLKSDYIYDISIDIDDGATHRTGFLYFLPQISFYASSCAQVRTPVQGGGYEIGADPRLNIKWAIPKVYDGIDFVYSNDSAVLSFMGTTLNDVYNDGRNITALDFRINISTDFSVLNSGSLQAALLISYGTPNFSAQVSGKALSSSVRLPDDNGFVNFDLLGRMDENAELPVEEEYGLPDGDILPGTVYYMNIKPSFKNEGIAVNAVSVGSPSAMNGSLLLGPNNYTYTPIRFQLTKDAINNLYIKIYKINQGTLDLPRLFYEVQSSDDPTIPGDWPVKKTLDDSYFGGEFAYTVIAGINPVNEIYYKIVVKSDGAADKIESSKLLYTINEDTSRPPVPIGIIAVASNLHPIAVGEDTVKTSDIKISWEKPSNWDQIKQNIVEDNDIVFHMLLSINATDITSGTDPVLESEGVSYGNFPVKYRLVKYISSKYVTENGDRLEYVLDGSSLFKGVNYNGVIEDIENIENYPNFLLPNKIYYLQMYTTTGANRGTTDPEQMSDKSIGTSFTTLSGVDRDVPLPPNFGLNINEIDSSDMNVIEVQFDKVIIDWSNYSTDADADKFIFYDLYMSTRTDTDSFLQVATTEGVMGDVLITGHDNPQATYIKEEIKSFSEGTAAYALFGSRLLPNTTYYFIVKTRLYVQGENDKISIATAILPVTTLKGDSDLPDATDRKPLAPTDFDIERDIDGNLLLTGQTVTFNWMRAELETSYSLICTSAKVAPDAGPSSYENDPVYKSFIANFDGEDSVIDNKVLLNPVAVIPVNNLEYDVSTKTCDYTINKWIFPNRLYYFSIRAEREGKESVWVSIPVTTSLIEAPTLLGSVDDYEIGFFWEDNSLNMRAEDYKIYLKGPKDIGYKILTREQAAIVKDNDTYYARLLDLTANSTYSVQVYKGINNATLVYQKEGLSTRDSYHQLEIKWRGLLVDEYSKYEIAIKTAGNADYTTLTSSDLEQYTDKNGKTYSYYIENSMLTVGTINNYYHAKIKSVLVTLPDGTTQRQPLKSNTQYYVKVRGIKTDPSDTMNNAYSKYIGPVNSRTEFSQQDYDQIDQETKGKATFLDRVAKLEEDNYWRMDISDNDANKILLKGARFVNEIQNSRGNSITVELGGLNPVAVSETLYIPISVINTLKTKSKNLVVKVAESEFTIRPKTFDVKKSTAIKKMQDVSGSKNVYVKFAALQSDDIVFALPTGTTQASKDSELKVSAVACSKSDTELKDLFYNKIYDSKTGLLKTKMDMLMTYAETNADDFSQNMDIIIEGYISDIKSQLSDFVELSFEGNNATRGAIIGEKTIRAFDSPMLLKQTYTKQKGARAPFVYYDGTTSWKRLTNNVTDISGSIRYSITKTGKYMILSLPSVVEDLPDAYQSGGSVDEFLTKYDLSSVFVDIDQLLDLSRNVSGKETVLIAEMVMGKTKANKGLDIKKKLLLTGLNTIISSDRLSKNITREELAGVLAKVYSFKLGISTEKLKQGKSIYITDDSLITVKFRKSVLVVIAKDMMQLDENNNFLPKSLVTRDEVLTGFTNVLISIGDIKLK